MLGGSIGIGVPPFPLQRLTRVTEHVVPSEHCRHGLDIVSPRPDPQTRKRRRELREGVVRATPASASS